MGYFLKYYLGIDEREIARSGPLFGNIIEVHNSFSRLEPANLKIAQVIGKIEAVVSRPTLSI